MRSLPLGLRIAPYLAALVLVGCGPRGPSIPAIPSSASGGPAISAHTGEASVPKKVAKPGPRQKRLTQLAPMPWPKE
jgi:hypothetical protein